MRRIALTVNGVRREAEVEPRLLLVHYLRDILGLTGTYVGCDTSQCGACTIIMNGAAVKSCTVLAVQADGAELDHHRGPGEGWPAPPDPEGVLEEPRPPVRLLHARHDHGRPGSDRERRRHGEEEIRLGLEGNLCRCTGYQNIVKAIQEAAGEMRQAAPAVAQGGSE